MSKYNCIIVSIFAISILPITLSIPSLVYQFTNGPVYKESQIQLGKETLASRIYWPTWWVSTKPVCSGVNVNITAGFVKLENYFKGANKKRMAFSLTQPQLLRFKVKHGKTCGNSGEEVSQMMYVPYDPKVRPTSPLSRSLGIVDSPAIKLLIRGFINGGIEWSKDNCQIEATNFKADLKTTNIYFDEEYFICGRYKLPSGRFKFEVGFQRIPRPESAKKENGEHHYNSTISPLE